MIDQNIHTNISIIVLYRGKKASSECECVWEFVCSGEKSVKTVNDPINDLCLPGSVTAPPCTVEQSGFGLVSNLCFPFGFHHKPEIKGLKQTAQRTSPCALCVCVCVL